MKCTLPLVVTTFTALLLAGCETSGTTARIQEKSATYAALAPEQQQAIQAGAVDIGYTTDMVYLALGKPSKIETKETADGPVTVWTYTRFYPTEAVAETWSVSRYEPANLQVLFYQDKVFDAAIKVERPNYFDFYRDRMSNFEGNATNRGLLGPGPAVPPASTPPGAMPITPPSPTP
ncbi:MAG: hypothetical protein H7A44_04025 [Opitutaceae bacterium]|nr:hypothetical protein [Cephaloticoccus sp.]MCP5529588.1 hypothetical protein [Opitutaceae bacterium]